MKKLIFGLSALSLLLLTSCSSPEYKNGKKFTFDDKEIESKLVYFCQDKPNLAPIALRAEKAHAYFTEQNNANAEMLIKTIGEEDSTEAMAKFQKRAEDLALEIHKKFSCTLIDSIEY